MRYQLSQEARTDLQSAADYIAADNPPRAIQFLDDLEAVFLFLIDRPHSGRRRPDLSNHPSHRFWVLHGYLIGYDPTLNPFFIFCILHGARDLGPVL